MAIKSKINYNNSNILGTNIFNQEEISAPLNDLPVQSTINYLEHTNITPRDYYKGTSFRYSKEWLSGTHYLNDQYIIDFVVYNNVLLRCKKSHLSSLASKPINFIYDSSGNISGINSEYWDFVLTGISGSSSGIRITNNYWEICNDTSVPVNQQVWVNTGIKAKFEFSDLSASEVATLQQPAIDLVENFINTTIVQNTGQNENKVISQKVVTNLINQINNDLTNKADKATTIAGYGITDAKIESGVITIGSNTITPLTSHQDISGKADKVIPSSAGNIAMLDSTGNPADSGVSVDDVQTEPEIFWVEYGITAYDDILAAYDDGKLCLLKYEDNDNNRLFVLGCPRDGDIVFYSLNVNGYIYYIQCQDDDSWHSSLMGVYEKPFGGIPKTDLADAVQTSLGKADTAYQKSQYGIPESDLAGEVKAKLKETLYISSLPTSDITSTDDLNDVISRSTLLKLAEGESSALIYNQLTEYGMSESDFAQTECVITKASKIVGDRNNKFELTFVLNGYEYAITADYDTRVATVTVTAVQDITNKADKVSGATNGNLAALDSNGNLTDSGKSASDFQPTIDSSNKLEASLVSGLATVATSGSFNDLSNKPDEVEANPTVPSGTTPTVLTGLKIGNSYYSAPSVVALTNNEIDTIWTNAS